MYRATSVAQVKVTSKSSNAILQKVKVKSQEQRFVKAALILPKTKIQKGGRDVSSLEDTKSKNYNAEAKHGNTVHGVRQQ